jgi:hypothetical protein
MKGGQHDGWNFSPPRDLTHYGIETANFALYDSFATFGPKGITKLSQQQKVKCTNAGKEKAGNASNQSASAI